MNPGAPRKDESWQNQPARVQNAQPIQRNAANAVPNMPPDQVQAQILLNLAKSQGIDTNAPNSIEHLQALFQRQSVCNDYLNLILNRS